MVLQKERTPVERFSFAAESQRGFDASGMTPDFVKHYFSACLQAVDNLSRPYESANNSPIFTLISGARVRVLARVRESLVRVL
jgi:hypothetical protein